MQLHEINLGLITFGVLGFLLAASLPIAALLKQRATGKDIVILLGAIVLGTTTLLGAMAQNEAAQQHSAAVTVQN